MAVNSSLAMQKDIKDNAEDLQEFLKDLDNWESYIKLEDEKLSNSKENDSVQISTPVRSKKMQSSSKGAMKTSSGESKRIKDEGENHKKKKISAFDYAGWDKFDVDKALVSSSEEEEGMEEESIKSRLQDSGNNKKERAVTLKDAGNKFYSNGRFEDAIAKYTQAMALDPTSAILPANRAMACIKLKKFDAAEADCNKSVRLDPGYIKAYLRRATACVNLGKTKLAVKDYRKVLELEPWNKEAKKELEKIERLKDGKVEIEKQGKSLVGNLKNQNITSSNVREVDMLKGNPIKVKEAVKQEESHTSQQNQSQKMRGNAGSSDESKGNRCGKKLNIVEVNSNPNALPEPLEPDRILPIEKPPHLRSLKPVKRIQVVDVPTKESLQKLPEMSVSDKGTKKKSASHYKEVSPKLPADASSSLKTQDKPPTRKAFPSVPKTSHQFEQDWRSLCNQESQAIKYLKSIQPTFFSRVDLDTDTFIGLVSALKSEEMPAPLAAQYLTALSKLSGFTVNVMFLDKNQRKVLDDVIMKCEGEICSSQLKTLRECLA